MTDPERQVGMKTISVSSCKNSLQHPKEKNIVLASTLSLASPPSTTPSDDSKPTIVKDLTLPQQRGINNTSRQLRRKITPGLYEVDNTCLLVI